MKSTLKSLLISLLVFLIFGEILARLLDGSVVHPPPYDTSQLDEHLGWKAKPNYLFEGTMQDFAGKTYPVHLSTAHNGFRSYDGPRRDSTASLLIIGDSYTQAVEVSDDKTYFAYLKKALGIPINAYGMAGYGTLQEYLLIDQYLDSLQPDRLLLQLCTNDFINNAYELEWNSFANIGLRRPYLSDADNPQIVYRTPVPGWRQGLHYLQFFAFIDEKLRRISMQYGDESARPESKIAREGLAYTPFQQSVAHTEAMLRMIRARVPQDVHLMAFCSDGYQPQRGQFREMCERLNITWIDGPYPQLERALGADSVIYSSDGYHWNETGHRIVAEALLAAFDSLTLANSSPTRLKTLP
jgi:hypothetical protein